MEEDYKRLQHPVTSQDDNPSRSLQEDPTEVDRWAPAQPTTSVVLCAAYR
jgi:hypothetical protein